MSYLDKTRCALYIHFDGHYWIHRHDAEYRARQADAEIEKLRKEIDELTKKIYEWPAREYWLSGAADKDLRLAAAVMKAAGSEDPIKLIEAAKKLPKTADGVIAIPKMKLYPLHPITDGLDPEELAEVDDDFAVVEIIARDGVDTFVDGDTMDISTCFSAKESAEKAKEAARES